MITKKEIENCCDLGLRTLCDRLISERDEALRWKEAYREFIKTLPLPIEVSDMEAKRIFEEGK